MGFPHALLLQRPPGHIEGPPPPGSLSLKPARAGCILPLCAPTACLCHPVTLLIPLPLPCSPSFPGLPRPCPPYRCQRGFLNIRLTPSTALPKRPSLLSCTMILCTVPSPKCPEQSREGQCQRPVGPSVSRGYGRSQHTEAWHLLLHPATHPHPWVRAGTKAIAVGHAGPSVFLLWLILKLSFRSQLRQLHISPSRKSSLTCHSSSSAFSYSLGKIYLHLCLSQNLSYAAL